MLILREFKNVTCIGCKGIQIYDKPPYPAFKERIIYNPSILSFIYLINSIINQIFSNFLCI